MVTVVDPNGTPVPVYTRSGTTIQEISANGTTQGAGTSIVAVSGWSVVLVDTSSGNTAVVLPDDADIGDLVEIHCKNGSGSNVLVFPSSGQSIGANAANVSTDVLNENGRSFRKVASTNWRPIGAIQ